MPADPEPLRLTDLLCVVSGWPTDVAAVERLWHAADPLLPEGRAITRALTPAEVAALVLVAGGLDAEPAATLVDLARNANQAGFRALARQAGVPPTAIATVWTRTQRHLGVPVTALRE